MGILAWMVFGLIVGVISKLLMPGHDPGGIGCSRKNFAIRSDVLSGYSWPPEWIHVITDGPLDAR